jgi:hypothetical protein
LSATPTPLTKRNARTTMRPHEAKSCDLIKRVCLTIRDCNLKGHIRINFFFFFFFWLSCRTSSTTYHRTRGASIFRVLPPTTTERLCQLLSFRTLTRATRGRNRPCGVSTRIVHRSTLSRRVESRPRYHTSRRGDHRPLFISLPSRIGIFLVTELVEM